MADVGYDDIDLGPTSQVPSGPAPTYPIPGRPIYDETGAWEKVGTRWIQKKEKCGYVRVDGFPVDASEDTSGEPRFHARSFRTGCKGSDCRRDVSAWAWHAAHRALARLIGWTVAIDCLLEVVPDADVEGSFARAISAAKARGWTRGTVFFAMDGPLAPLWRPTRVTLHAHVVHPRLKSASVEAFWEQARLADLLEWAYVPSPRDVVTPEALGSEISRTAPPKRPRGVRAYGQAPAPRSVVPPSAGEHPESQVGSVKTQSQAPANEGSLDRMDDCLVRSCRTKKHPRWKRRSFEGPNIPRVKLYDDIVNPAEGIDDPFDFEVGIPVWKSLTIAEATRLSLVSLKEYEDYLTELDSQRPPSRPPPEDQSNHC